MSESDLVVMRCGLAVPVTTLRRLWEIEARGVHVRLDGGDLLIGPRYLLDDADLAFVQRQKALIISMLSMPATTHA